MKLVSKNLHGKQNSIIRVIKIMLGILLFSVIGLIRMQAQTVTDIDGNVYNTVIIGTQVWMAENLKTTKYNDGTEIPYLTDDGLHTPGYCWYNNDETTYKATYGALYNWWAAYTSYPKNICPTGWHVPNVSDWQNLLIGYLGGGEFGGKLKETGTTHWLSPNTGATNETGFTALPGGVRFEGGNYTNIGNRGYWWCSTYYTTYDAYYYHAEYNSEKIFQDVYFRNSGFSVRCLRDQLVTDIINPSASILEIYPNPVSDILKIEYKYEYFETVSILNSQGVRLTTEKTIVPEQQLDFSKYISGLYFLEFIKTSGEITRVKVLKH